MSVGQRLARDGAAWLVGAVLVLAGLLKTGRALDLGRVIEGYQLLPALAVPTLAAILPWLEVAVGALLLAGQLRLGAAAVAVVLSAGFLVAGGSVVLRGLETECGCFGAWSGSVGALTLSIDLVLLAASIFAIRAAWKTASAS